MHLVCTPIKKSYSSSKVNFLIRDFNPKYQDSFSIKIFNYEECYNQIKSNFLISKLIRKKYFPEIVSILNNFHNKNFSTDYWNVLIGLWTQRNIDMILFKFNLLNSTNLLNKINSVNNITNSNIQLNATNTYYSIISNQNLIQTNMIYIDILNFLKKDITIIDVQCDNYKPYYEKIKFSKFSKNFFVNKISPLITQTYLGKKNEIFLNINLKSVPRFWSIPEEIFVKNNPNVRESLSDRFYKKSISLKFEEYFKYSFFKLIPNCYLEGFEKNYMYSKSLNLPKNPKFIFSANYLPYHELFRFYLADQKEKKTKIIAYQHGGNYGSAKFIANPSSEEEFCDKFLTWGWTEQKKNVPMFMYVRKKIFYNKKNKNILFFVDGISGEYFPFDSYAILRKHNNKVIELLNLFPKSLKSQIIIKTHPRKDSLNKINFKSWKDFNKKNKNIFNLNNDNTPNLVRNLARYAIHTYEGTAFLEDLHLNNPFYLILKNDIRFIRNTSKKYFKLLLDNNIAFENSVVAAEFIIKNHNKIEDWWSSKKIQFILKKVRFALCRYEPCPVKKLTSFLSKI